MARVLDAADRADAGIHLTTYDERTARWYQSFGFRVIARFEPTATWPTVIAMWRDRVSGSPSNRAAARAHPLVNSARRSQ